MKLTACAAFLGSVFSWVSWLNAAEIIPASAAAQSHPTEVMNFALLDYHGRSHELRRADAKVVVCFFTGNGCPIARQSLSKIKSLRGKFAKEGTVFWLIDSNPQDDRESVEKEARELEIGSLPVLLDEQQAVARYFGVRRTCETFAINTKDWSVLYHGGIDDQFVEGAQKPKPTEKYLETALTEFFSGKAVSRSQGPVAGCLIHFDWADRDVSYETEVAPLLQRKCVSCHSPGNIGPWSMSSHKKVKGMSDMMHEVLLARRMPPWSADPHFGTFANDVSLTEEESHTLLRWIEQGSPRGPGADPLTNSTAAGIAGWELGRPDVTILLPATQTIPATGVLSYRHVDSDYESPRDLWVRAAIVRPDNRRVLHHVIVRIKYPAGARGKGSEEVFFTSWAPGKNALAFPAGTGKLVPQGARFNFELHYTTNGKEEVDRSELGLYLMDSAPSLVLETRTSESRELNIPPGESDARSFCMYPFKKESVIYDLVPHMHLRGSWFKYEALYPDGNREVLLSVPRYDFNWQTIYRFASPKKVPAGTWLLCTGGHDNSSRNPNNPDPSKRVKWGLQSFDEMFMGFMDVAELPAARADAGAGTIRGSSRAAAAR